jgi:hypothetical protein
LETQIELITGRRRAILGRYGVQLLAIKRNGRPITKQDVEAIGFGVFAAPGLRISASISTAESGLNDRTKAYSRNFLVAGA